MAVPYLMVGMGGFPGGSGGDTPRPTPPPPAPQAAPPADDVAQALNQLSEQLERIEFHVKPRKGSTPDAKIQTALRELRVQLEGIEDQVSVLEVSRQESVTQLVDQLDRIENFVQQRNEPPPELEAKSVVSQLSQLVERVEALRNVLPSEVNTQDSTNQLKEQLDRIEVMDRWIAVRGAYREYCMYIRNMNSFIKNVHQQLAPLRAVPIVTRPPDQLAFAGPNVPDFPVSTSDLHTKDMDRILALLDEYDLLPWADNDKLNRLLLAMFIGVGDLYYSTYIQPS